jgi:hypothetical protein
VAVGVVDALEVIDVEHHHRQRVAVASGARELRPPLFHEVTTIGDAGQRVGAGEVAQARLHRLVLGNVADREHQGLGAPVVHRPDPRLDRDEAAVAAQVA